MVATGANRQPAAVAYVRGEDGQLRAHSVQVHTIGPEGIERIVAFIEPRLFERFGTPAEWSPDRAGQITPTERRTLAGSQLL